MKRDLAGRPLLAASIGLIVGISAIDHPLNFLFLALLLYLSRQKPATCVWAAAACVIGLILAPPPSKPLSQDFGSMRIEGVVSTPPSVGRLGETSLVNTGNHLFQVIFEGRTDIAMGQRVQAYGRILPPHGDYTEMLETEGAAATLLCRSGDSQVLRSGPIWFEMSSRARESFFQDVRNDLDQDQAAMVGAMCFGAGGVLDRAAEKRVDRLGVAHILSASGLQVYLLALMLQLLLSRLPIKRGGQIALIVFVLALYASATGLHPAVIRSSIVAVVALAAYLFRREPDLLSALGLAAILTLLWQPWTVYTPGFQVCFVTSLALALFWRPLKRDRSRRFLNQMGSRLWLLFRTSLVATLAALPVTAFHFGEVSFVAPVANLAITPVVPVIIAAGLIAWPLGLISGPFQAGVFRAICGPLAGWILLVTDWMGNQPWCAVQVPAFNAYWIALYYGAVLLARERFWPTR